MGAAGFVENIKAAGYTCKGARAAGYAADIKLAGYSVGKLDGDQIGIKLEGSNEACRPWFLRADSAQDVAAQGPVGSIRCTVDQGQGDDPRAGRVRAGSSMEYKVYATSYPV